jgi:hypothetical protein
MQSIVIPNVSGKIEHMFGRRSYTVVRELTYVGDFDGMRSFDYLVELPSNWELSDPPTPHGKGRTAVAVSRDGKHTLVVDDDDSVFPMSEILTEL